MNDGKIGFIGLGVMGEPMCRNIANKSGRPVRCFDIDPKPVERLAVHNVEAAANLSELARDCETICIALPSGKHLDKVCRGDGGLLAATRKGQIVVDFGTSPVDLTREIAAAFAAKGARYADAPIARTRWFTDSVRDQRVSYQQFPAPRPGFVEQVYAHDVVAADQHVRLVRNSSRA